MTLVWIGVAFLAGMVAGGLYLVWALARAMWGDIE